VDVAGDDYVRIYVDGGAEQAVTKSGTAASSSAGFEYDFSVGRAGEWGTDGLARGAVGAVWAWNTALSDADRTANEALLTAVFN